MPKPIDTLSRRQPPAGAEPNSGARPGAVGDPPTSDVAPLPPAPDTAPLPPAGEAGAPAADFQAADALDVADRLDVDVDALADAVAEKLADRLADRLAAVLARRYLSVQEAAVY